MVADNSEALATMQTATQPQTTPSPPRAHVSPPTPPDDRDYLAKPLKFLFHGPMVPFGRSSDAALPAPGAERSSLPTTSAFDNIAVSVSIPPAIVDDTIITFGEDIFKTAPKFREGDWSECHHV